MTSIADFKQQIVLLHKQHNTLAHAATAEAALLNVLQLKELQRELLALEHELAAAIAEASKSGPGGSLLGKLLRRGDNSPAHGAAHVAQLHQILQVTRSIQSDIGQATIPSLDALIVRHNTSHQPVDYHSYIRSDAWRQKAEAAKERAGNRCQLCNRSRSEIQLDAHHRTYERLGNELPGDITVLCRECHQNYEDNKPTITASKPCVKCGTTFTPLASSHHYCVDCYLGNGNANVDNVTSGNGAGYCIRCRDSIPLNPQAPYCRRCYKIWKKYENRAYEEKHCHICGEQHLATMLKPACYRCYREHRHVLAFG